MFDTNLSPEALAAPIQLTGVGVSNLVCKSCDPPPSPECGLDGDVSVYFESTSSTDCENEDGVCSYLMMEQVCEHGPCDGDTQQCPLSAHWDAGWVDPDLNSDNDNDGILNGDDEYPDHNNDDLQFIIDLIEQSGLSVALGPRRTILGKRAFVEANAEFESAHRTLPESVQNPDLLQLLHLDGNSMSGDLPEALYTLTNLVSLKLSNNFFPAFCLRASAISRL